jgi:hypothetical protein
MPDTYRITAPDGTVLKMQLDAPPTDAQALDVVRSYGDAQAAAAQQKAEAGSTFGSQLTGRNSEGDLNILHDAGTVAGAGWDVLKTLVKEGWKNPLFINQPDIKYDPAAHAQDPTLSDRAASALGTLRTLPAQAAKFIQHPIDTTVDALQNAGVTPDMAAHAGGTVAALAAVGATLPNAGRLTTSTGNLVTRGGQAMNPAMTKTLGEGLGALAEAGLGGASASPTMGSLGRVFAGSKIGGAIGEALPAITQRTGRLITKAGQFMGSATGTPAGLTPPAPPVQPNTLLRADDLKGMLEEAMAQRDAPTGSTAPPTDVPPAGAGRTEEGAVSSGRPAVTPERYQEIQAQAQAAARPTPAAAEPPLVTEAEAAAAAPPEPPSTLRDQLVASLEKNAPQPAPGVIATEGVKPPPPTLDPEAQAVRDQTAAPESADPKFSRANIAKVTARADELAKDGMPFGKAIDQAWAEANAAGKPAAAAATSAVADEAEAAGVPEEADTAARESTTRTPAPAELTPDEIRRKEIGARDFAAEQRRETGVKETPDEVRARTQARTTGKTSQVSVLPTGAVNRITGTLKDMIASGASDAELLEYLNKAPSDKSKQQIGLLLNALLHGTGRNIVGLGGAAVTGAMLRKALVGQLQGNDKQEQD